MPTAEQDYYFDEDGNLVFTEEYLLKRGFCCGCSCKHCPYETLPNGKVVVKTKRT